jgi:hypothetical protein
MNKNNSGKGKDTVALLLAAVLVTGIFGVLAPSIVDAQASEDKRYGDNRHGDYDKRYDNTRHEDKRYDDKRHDNYRHDDKRDDKRHDSSAKYISCKNININGKDGTHGSPGHNDFVGAEEFGSNTNGFGSNSMWPGQMGMGMHQDRNHGFQKFTDKDVVVICIQNNGNDGGNNGPKDCAFCFSEKIMGEGIIPKGQFDKLVAFLPIQTIVPEVDNIEELCELLEELAKSPATIVTQEELEDFLDLAFGPGQNNGPVIADIVECLTDAKLIEPTDSII